MKTKTQIQIELERLKIDFKITEAFLNKHKKDSEDYEFALIDFNALRERIKMLEWVLN